MRTAEADESFGDSEALRLGLDPSLERPLDGTGRDCGGVLPAESSLSHAIHA